MDFTTTLIIVTVCYAVGWAIGYATCAILYTEKLKSLQASKVTVRDLRPRD